ncbi:MAG: DUF2335 domain-containing protein [Hyphomicrobiales bacterium]
MKTPAEKSKKSAGSRPQSASLATKQDDAGGADKALVRAEIREAVWQGPVLPPAILKQYDSVIDNGAERLFKQFENESAHRRDLDRLGAHYKGRDLIAGKILP